VCQLRGGVGASYTWTHGQLTSPLLDDPTSPDRETSDDVTAPAWASRKISLCTASDLCVSCRLLYLNHLFLCVPCVILTFSRLWLCRLYVLGCDVLHSVRSISAFRKNVLPPSSESKSKPSNKHSLLYFDPEDRGSNFLINEGYCKSFSTSSSHLSVGLPTFLLPSGLLSKKFHSHSCLIRTNHIFQTL
jgi:hypothetical protein